MKKSQELSDPNSCFNKAKDEEIIFVLLGRDESSPGTIRDWVERRVRSGKNAWSDLQIIEALSCAKFMEDQRVNKDTKKEVQEAAERGFNSQMR